MSRKVFILVAIAFIFICNVSFKNPIGKDDYYIVISKSDYTLSIYDANDSFVISYPAVFGKNGLGDKMIEGDKLTPEGTFHIASKKIHAKWDRFLALDYPNAESYKKFNERKAKGIIPKNAKIGGGIGIHGTWPNEDFAVNEHQNWTLGCVSTTNNYVRILYDYLPVGTRIEIEP